jgi:hypothetical protein
MHEYYIKNKGKINKQCSEYREKNRDKINKQRIEWREKNRDKINREQKKRNQKNKEKINERLKELRVKNRDKINKHHREWRKKNRDKINKKVREHNKTNNLFRLSNNLRASLYSSLKAQNASKNARTLEYSCCSVAFLYTHLKKQFTNGMTWENYGEWHIDHRRPRASFNLNNEGEIYMCQHYTNLQPMWKIENLKKGDDFDHKAFEYEWKGKDIGWQLKLL